MDQPAWASEAELLEEAERFGWRLKEIEHQHRPAWQWQLNGRPGPTYLERGLAINYIEGYLAKRGLPD